MFCEDDLLPISALQHLAFCERQWALIYVEQVWEDNRLTAEGRVLHEVVDGSGYETRHGIRTARSLPLRSLRLGLVGRADVVEFHCVGPPEAVCEHSGALGFRLPAGRWEAYPIEFKRGRPKRDVCDEVQLCAQALCIEEMLGVTVPKGALFYGQTRHRTEVVFSLDLRKKTEALTERLHALWQECRTPPPVPEPKCRNCSLVDICMPSALGRPRRVRDYIKRAIWTPDSDRGQRNDEE
ncbi:MAG: CRISPR-associated protein Cas4 [Candidatus Sumerlaeaceae bacterium]|nr:CRISPR-associated protein Cas4 [Candidatus Sumerlaeaceae bacterium]